MFKLKNLRKTKPNSEDAQTNDEETEDEEKDDVEAGTSRDKGKDKSQSDSDGEGGEGGQGTDDEKEGEGKGKEKEVHAEAGEGQEEDFWHQSSPEEALNKLGVTRAGLTTQEANERLNQYGPNKLEEKTVNPVIKFLLFYWNPFAWAMEVAALIAIGMYPYASFFYFILFYFFFFFLLG